MIFLLIIAPAKASITFFNYNMDGKIIQSFLEANEFLRKKKVEFFGRFRYNGEVCKNEKGWECSHADEEDMAALEK